jgi:hypothetical protein
MVSGSGATVAAPTPSLSGTIAAAGSGLGIPGAWVALYEGDLDADMVSLVDEVYTDDSGWYEFHRELVFGADYAIEVTADGYYPLQPDGWTTYIGDPLVLDASMTRYAEVIEHDAVGVTFDRWVTGHSDSYSGGGYVYGKWSGTRLDAQFIGNTVKWVGPKQPSYGMADVYIDGVKVRTVDCYVPASGATREAVIFKSNALSDGVHTLSIRLSGAKNNASSGTVVVLDYLVAEGKYMGSHGSRIDQDEGTFTGAWVKASNPTYYQGGYAYSRWSGATWRADFEGARVAWIGPMGGSYGRARVYIDGKYMATVSQYGTQGWRKRVWTSPFIHEGVHTIEIRPMGTRDAASKGVNVVVDAIDAQWLGSSP